MVNPATRIHRLKPMVQMERCCHLPLLVSVAGLFVVQQVSGPAPLNQKTRHEAEITVIDPPEQEFFAKRLDFHGMPRDIVAKFNAQFTNSLANGLWRKSYSGSNPDEFFAELTMWYFGTHGDLGMTGPKPSTGREGFKVYDAEAFALFDDFYSGRI